VGFAAHALDLAVNALTMSGLSKGVVTVFGGEQVP
jgi:hypothetical protein